MARIRASSGFDENNITLLDDGDVSAGARLIRILDGGIRVDYRGSFTFDNAGDVEGILRSITYFDSGQKIFTATGVRDAAAFARALDTGSQAQIRNFLLDSPDSFKGSTSADNFNALGDNDIVRGRGGDDTLKGGLGDDTIGGGSGDDRLIGQGGADVIRGGGGADRALGGGGDDRLIGGGGDDRVVGGAGDDTIIGGGGNDVLKGGGGADQFMFNASHGADVIKRFEQGADQIEIDGANRLRDLSIDQNGGDVVITFGDLQVTVENQSADDFTRADFIF